MDNTMLSSTTKVDDVFSMAGAPPASLRRHYMQLNQLIYQIRLHLCILILYARDLVAWVGQILSVGNHYLSYE